MRISELKGKGALYISNISQGFFKYSYEICKLSAGDAYQMLDAKGKKETTIAAYADFYYHTLDSQAKERIHSLLTEEEIIYIQQLTANCVMDAEDPDIIFPLEKKLLDIITKLNEGEMLFSTVYFIEKTRCSTWWGNYNEEYIVFTIPKEGGEEE